MPISKKTPKKVLCKHGIVPKPVPKKGCSIKLLKERAYSFNLSREEPSREKEERHILKKKVMQKKQSLLWNVRLSFLKIQAVRSITELMTI